MRLQYTWAKPKVGTPPTHGNLDVVVGLFN